MGSKVTTVILLVIVVRYILLLSGSRLLLLHIHIMATSDVKISCIQMLFFSKEVHKSKHSCFSVLYNRQLLMY